MKVTFPAMRGHIGQRQYYATMMSLAEIPRLFKFTDWEDSTPELRAQRVLNKSRVPHLAKYIVDNEDGYLFSSITASYRSEVRFVPFEEGSDIGNLEMELENIEFIINDGQHRCAAIASAVKENPALAKERISVLLFEMENMERLQQMFSDLNRFAHKTSKSLDILYDHRDNLSALVMEAAEEVEVFRGMVDKERLTIPVRSPKLFTLSVLYDATKELLGSKVGKKGSKDFNAKLQTAIEYWNRVAESMPDWLQVKADKLDAKALRQEKISTHAVVMRALGGLGNTLLEDHPDDWRERLKALREIDWRKAKGNDVNPLWDNVCITAGSVVSNRQARAGTLAKLKELVGVGKPAGKKSAA
ncbi:MAG: DNA sulfur modification protein DndB [Bacteroidota bacterium]